MAVPTNKDELLKAIDANFDKLIKELRAVPLSLVDERSPEGHAKGTQMSVANLAAYLVGWNELVLKWLDQTRPASRSISPRPASSGTNWAASRRSSIATTRSSLAATPDRLVAAKDRIVLQIETHSEHELYGTSWYGKWTMGRMIQFNTASPMPTRAAACVSG